LRKRSFWLPALLIVAASGLCPGLARADVACKVDKECPGDQVCNAGQCADPAGATRTEPTPVRGACSIDKDCAGDQVCNAGQCADPGVALPAEGPGRSGSARGSQCFSRGDCAPGLTCREFTCQSPAVSEGASLVPAVAIGGVAVVAFGVAAVWLVLKGSAQSKANHLETQIKGAGGGSSSCTDPSASVAAACVDYHSDINDVNQDATIGNVALGVGIAAAAGSLAWLAIAIVSNATHAPPRATLVPILGPRVGGLGIGWSF
jgi:hypothetical protein